MPIPASQPPSAILPTSDLPGFTPSVSSQQLSQIIPPSFSPPHPSPLVPSQMPSLSFRARAFARSHPRLVILGSLASYLPVAIFFNNNIAQLMWINGPSMSPFFNSDYNSSLKQDVVLVKMWDQTVGLRRGSVVAFW